MNELKEKYSIIGDVRGFGLFLGIELVRDPESLEPADKEADQIMNSMKEKGILISTIKEKLYFASTLLGNYIPFRSHRYV